MKPVKNTRKRHLLHYDLNYRKFDLCLKCFLPLHDNPFMHNACWDTTTQEERNKCYELADRMEIRGRTAIEVEE